MKVKQLVSKLFNVLMFLNIASCIPVYWNADFEMHRKVEQSTTSINKVFGYNVFVSDNKNGKAITLTISNVPWIASFKPNTTTLGLTSCHGIECHISLSNKMYSYEVVSTIMHEIGHVMGLNHVNYVEDIMNTFAPDYLDLDTMAKQLLNDCKVSDCAKYIYIKSIDVEFY